MKNLANNLMLLRKNNNFTQDDIAEKVYVSRQAVSKWERGESIPDIETLEALSELYNVTLDDIIKTDLSLSNNIPESTDTNSNFDELRKSRKRQNAKLMTVWCFLLFACYALVCGIVHVALVNVCEHIWLVYFTIPIVPPIIFAIRFRYEIGKKWLMFFVNVPFISTLIYLLIIIAGNRPGAWIAFLLIPVYYIVAVLFLVYQIKLERSAKTLKDN